MRVLRPLGVGMCVHACMRHVMAPRVNGACRGTTGGRLARGRPCTAATLAPHAATALGGGGSVRGCQVVRDPGDARVCVDHGRDSHARRHAGACVPGARSCPQQPMGAAPFFWARPPLGHHPVWWERCESSLLKWLPPCTGGGVWGGHAPTRPPPPRHCALRRHRECQGQAATHLVSGPERRRAEAAAVPPLRKPPRWVWENGAASSSLSGMPRLSQRSVSSLGGSIMDVCTRVPTVAVVCS